MLKVYRSDYEDFELYTEGFFEGAKGFVLDYEESQWYATEVVNVKDIPGTHGDYEGEFITAHNEYYVGMNIVKELDGKPEMEIVGYC